MARGSSAVKDRAHHDLPSLEECHALLVNSPVGIFTSTPDGRFLFINDALARLYGYDGAQAMIGAVTDIAGQLYADPRDRTEFARCMQNRAQVNSHECRMVRRDGSVFWASLHARAVTDENHNVLYYQGFLIDITDRKLAEKQSRLSEEKFTQVFMAAPDCIAIVRLADGHAVDVNLGFEEITGWKRSEVLGRSSVASGFWVEPGERKAMIEELNRGRDVMNREFTFRDSGGAVRDGVYSARPILIDGEPHYIFILRDVTERKQAEESLRLTQFAMDRAPDSILWVGDRGELIYANDAACSSLGFSREELLKMKVFEVDPDFPVEGWEQHKVDLKRLGRMTFEGRHRTKDGRIFPVEVTTNYIDYKGRFLGIAFDRDITERRRSQEERDKLQNSLFQAQKMESLGILAGGVAHDFNNLLQIMGVNIELLLRSIDSRHPSAPRLQTVARAVDRAGKLVQQLLFFGRKAVIQPKPLDLNREVEEAVRILERTIPKMILITRHLASKLWPVCADPVQVEQVLLNLGANAVDAMPAGGKLLVETKNIVLDTGFPGEKKDARPGRYVLMSVTDTGCGMSRETLTHVFDPFFTTKELGKGTGLGLASTYGIVKAHKGHIQCYSEPGQGTTFKIYWPALEQGGMAFEAPPQLDKPRGGDETILVVDDEPDIRELTGEILQSFGYRVISAESGEQALDIYEQRGSDIDVVLLDLNMPGMGGTWCLRELLRRNPAARVIIASGYAENGQAREALNSGASGFVGKPYQIHELAHKVRAVLDE